MMVPKKNLTGFSVALQEMTRDPQTALAWDQSIRSADSRLSANPGCEIELVRRLELLRNYTST